MTKYQALLNLLEKDGILNGIRSANQNMKVPANMTPEQVEEAKHKAFELFIPKPLLSNPLLHRLANQAAQELLLNALWNDGDLMGQPRPVAQKNPNSSDPKEAFAKALSGAIYQAIMSSTDTNQN